MCGRGSHGAREFERALETLQTLAKDSALPFQAASRDLRRARHRARRGRRFRRGLGHDCQVQTTVADARQVRGKRRSLSWPAPAGWSTRSLRIIFSAGRASGCAVRRNCAVDGLSPLGHNTVGTSAQAHPNIVESVSRKSSGEVFPHWGRIIRQCADRGSPRLALARANSHRAESYVRYVQAILGEPIGTRLHVDKNPAMNLMIPPMKRVFPELKLVIAPRSARCGVELFLALFAGSIRSALTLTLERPRRTAIVWTWRPG